VPAFHLKAGTLCFCILRNLGIKESIETPSDKEKLRLFGYYIEKVYLCIRISINFKLKIMNDIPNNKGEIVMYQPDETIRLEVKMENETVWLTQQQMSELFQRDQSVIARHIRNIYKEEELSEEGTYAKFAYMGHDGLQRYEVTHYNLDVIISVGYRVKSKRGTKFRQWANRVLKDYLLKGYVVNQRITVLEQQVADLTKQMNFFVRSSLPPVEGIFYDGQIFDAYVHIVSLIKQAKQSIILIDNYIDETTLTMLSKRSAGVSAAIYTRRLTQQQQLDLQRHNQKYPPISIINTQHSHDRFLIIDGMVYVFGASLKDAGKKLFAYIKMQETNANDLLSRIR
jgi:hypothetical protein